MSKIRGNPDLGGMSATVGFFIGFAAVSLFGVTASKIKEVMSISPILLGLLISIPALSGSLLRTLCNTASLRYSIWRADIIFKHNTPQTIFTGIEWKDWSRQWDPPNGRHL